MHGLLELAAGAAVDRIWFDVLNPRPMVWPSLQEFLRQYRPDLMGLYRAVLFDSTERASYVQRTGEQFRRIAATLGLADRLA